MPEDFILHQYEIGPLNNFLYITGNAQTKEVAIVDPAWDVPFLLKETEKFGYTVVAVLLTHGHTDHVNGLEDVLAVHDVPVYISSQEAPFLKPVHANMVDVEDGQIIKVGPTEYQCILTPGHTPGGLCFKHKEIMIAGDTIFIDGCGRCDLPGGDPGVMFDSLYGIISLLPDETVVFPGHNYGPAPYATIGAQKKTNPFLTCSDKQEFLTTRM